MIGKMLRSHYRFWIGIMAFTLTLGALATPIMRVMQRDLDERLQLISAKTRDTLQAMRQFNDDIAMSKTFRAPKDRAELETVLQPTDRLQVANFLERQAELARFTHFEFSLAPEQLARTELPSGPQLLSQNLVHVSADAPHDSEIYNYLDQIQKQMPGRLRLIDLAIERLKPDDPALTASNLYFSATFEWLSNGSGGKDNQVSNNLAADSR